MSTSVVYRPSQIVPTSGIYAEVNRFQTRIGRNVKFSRSQQIKKVNTLQSFLDKRFRALNT